MFGCCLCVKICVTACLGVVGVKMLFLQHVWAFCGCQYRFYSTLVAFLFENVGFTACLGAFGVIL